MEGQFGLLRFGSSDSIHFLFFAFDHDTCRMLALGTCVCALRYCATIEKGEI